MEEKTENKSRLESEVFAKDFNKLENYLSRVMKKSRKSADDDFIEIPLTKQQLVDTNFSIAVSQNLFTQIAGGKQVRFDCVDKDLFFSEEEALALLQNYELIQKQGGDLYFHETLYDSADEYNNDEKVLLSFQLGRNDNLLYKVSFSEILGINQKLVWTAKKINEYSNKLKLTPFEKYMLCYKYIANIQYASNDFAPTHTYTGTMKENKGCCTGKSQYLRILLQQCGINSCCIITSDAKETLQLVIPMCEKYFSSATITIDGKDLQLYEAKTQLSQKLQNEKDLEKQISSNHCINLIHLDDDKYGIHGIFAADTCLIPAGFMSINDRKHLQNIFNFVSYSSLNHGCGFEDFMKDVKPQELSDEDIAKIEKEYFSIAREAIRRQISSNSPKNLGPIVRLKLKNFTLNLSNCNSFEQIKELFDDNRFEKTKFGKVCEEIFEKTFSDELGILALTTETCENRAALEGCPLAKTMPAEKFYASKVIANIAYNQIFGKQDLQK